MPKERIDPRDMMYGATTSEEDPIWSKLDSLSNADDESYAPVLEVLALLPICAA